jgi:hypothetical protein
MPLRVSGATLTLASVAALAVAGARRGSAFLAPERSEGSRPPTRREVEDLIDLGYSVDQIVDVYPEHVRWPPGDMVGVYIQAAEGDLLLQDNEDQVAEILR